MWIVLLALAAASFGQDTFNRSVWLSSWKDTDKDCQNTRQEVLIQESLIPVTFSEDGCKVKSGVWLCLYTGSIYTDPSDLDIDHLVPLGNANASGGYVWEPSRKKEYANFLDSAYHLIAVSKSANRSKQDKSPDQWMPSFAPYQCPYLRYWVSIKAQWELRMTAAESTFIASKLQDCR